jgi:hypothetical protein
MKIRLTMHIEQRQRRQRRRPDREALARRRGGVAEAVEHVGALADMRGLPGHLGVAARVVGDRAVRVGRQRDAEGGEHADRGDADAVEAHEEVSPPPAKLKAAMMATTTVISEAQVDFMPSAMPEMMTVAGPVSACSAIRCVGGARRRCSTRSRRR